MKKKKLSFGEKNTRDAKNMGMAFKVPKNYHGKHADHPNNYSNNCHHSNNYPNNYSNNYSNNHSNNHSNNCHPT